MVAAAARQNDPELGELAGLRIDLDRPAMLLDDDVVAQRQAKAGSLAGGLVVKNGLNIFSFTSGGMPVPLSRILISTLSPRFLVAAARSARNGPHWRRLCAWSRRRSRLRSD